ncbi:MAG: dockerin type I repeat-containing protein, partial [candidate division Zixibacteria bacterium]|nr:dockerin type I repeat-containing protein [candidate division Zixibacteria bacterium]
TLLASVNLWTWIKSGSDIIEYVSFEYSKSGSFTEIDRNFNPGISGCYRSWDFSVLEEGEYTLRTTATDTLGRWFCDTVTVYLEPTPPTGYIISPENGEVFCDPLELLMNSDDEDLSCIEIYRHVAHDTYAAGLDVFNASTLGTSHSGPAAAALAVKLWADRGYDNLMMDGYEHLTVTDFAQLLTSRFNTDENMGTYHEDLYGELIDHFHTQGNPLMFNCTRNPGYFDLRTRVEDEQRAVLIGIGSQPGIWLAVDGFKGWVQSDDNYTISVSDPRNGIIVDVPMRDSPEGGQLYLDGYWQTADIMISISPNDWTVARDLIGIDCNSVDGWQLVWTPNGVVDDSAYFFRSKGYDITGFTGISTVLIKYSCSNVYTPGDYNGDKLANIMDLIYLIDFLTVNGPPPVGGAERADANGDNYVNIADIIYYVNYIYRTAGLPNH